MHKKSDKRRKRRLIIVHDYYYYYKQKIMRQILNINYKTLRRRLKNSFKVIGVYIICFYSATIKNIELYIFPDNISFKLFRRTLLLSQ